MSNTTSPKAEAERRAEDIIKELPGMDGAIIEERINREFHRGYSAASSRWIKVEERLPETNSLVIVYAKGSLPPTYGWHIGGGRWVVNDEPDYSFKKTDNISFVTHWMPLPLPPTEQP